MVPADLPACALLEGAADALRAEALALAPEDFVPMPSREHYQGVWRGFLLRAGPWEHEFPGVDFPANRARCPVAARLIETLPGARVAGYLRLEPGADLGLHSDPRDDDTIRVHLALDLPEEEAEYWPIGTCRLLDVRQPHRATNPSDRARLTLVVDVAVGRVVADGEVAPWNPA